MSSKWLNQARANREVALELRRAAPEKSLEVARMAMVRYAQTLEAEAWVFEVRAFEEQASSAGCVRSRASSTLVH